ncbi:MAG: AraC family transcriptional regulator [Spirochaetes bacterium]|nr:AraC family transcriptional regulator [Spirochaetota bacterium]
MAEAPPPGPPGALAAYLLQHAALKVHQAAFFRPDPDWGMDDRRIDDWQLYAFTSGRGLFEQAGAKHEVASGDVLLCAPKSPYSLHYRGRAAMDHVSVHFTLLFAGEVDLMAWLGPPALLTHPRLRPALALLRSATEDKSPLGRERVRGLLTWLLADWMSRVPLEPGRLGRADRLSVLVAFHRALEARLEDPKPLRRILGMTLPLLEREMKRLTGKRPLQLILEARIERACKLLAAGESVTATAERLGFSDIYYFSKMFKKTAGMSPRNWLETLKRG